ncbi:MAG: 2Fe-2S iron-sulfur cluster-binding protein [Pseudomonadota bacterium]
MNTVHLTMNGRDITAREGMTLLDAATEAGIRIPTLCHEPALEPYGGCRLCMVETEKDGRTKLVTSCCAPVQDGLTVQTDTERVLRIRRMILELIWPANQTLSAEYGVTGSRFSAERPDCSLCGLCVRTCDEVTGRHAVFFQGRGADRRVAFVPGGANQCLDCRACFDRCAGGWLVTECEKWAF